MRLTNILLFVIAVLLAVNVGRVSSVRAASIKVRLQAFSKGSADVDGEIVGFSCVREGGFTQCFIASR
jgi:hypothetical protein